MNHPDPGQLLAMVRCSRCTQRLFDTRFAWRHAEISTANVVAKCPRCGWIVGIVLAISEAAGEKVSHD